MIPSANEISKALTSGNVDLIQRSYEQAFNKPLNTHCGDCIKDAKIELRIFLEQLERDKSEINLFVSVYKDSNPKRAEELEFCLWQNKNNEVINRVIEITHRPTFDEIFEMTKDYPEAVNIIANSDIFFDNSLPLAKKIKPNECYALTRWDWNGNGKAVFFNRRDSQDVWIFRGAVRKISAPFFMGRPGCDNRLAYEIKKAGYILTNPSVTIHPLHYHTSGVRNFSWHDQSQIIPKPYHLIEPCYL